MNKIRNKFLKIFLSLSMMATVGFATCAQAKNENEKVIYSVKFDYKDKGLEKDRETLEKNLGKINISEMNFKNKTSAKELVNLYAVMQKLVEKYNIPKDKLSVAKLDTKKQIKLTGTANIIANASKKNTLKKLLKDFNEEIKNIKITKKDFENAKNELIKEQKKEIKSLEDELKVFEGKDLIEMGKISIERILKQQKDILKSEKNKKNIELLKNSIKIRENKLKDNELLRKEGKEVYEIIKASKSYDILKNMKEHIKQIKNVKYEEVKNLTKELKIDTNDIKSGEVKIYKQDEKIKNI